MAPTRSKSSIIPTIASRPCTRQSKIYTDIVTKGKRKAEGGTAKEQPAKRSALGDVTNALTKVKSLDSKSKPIAKQPIKRVTVQSKVIPSVKTAVKLTTRHSENVVNVPCAPKNKVLTRGLPKCNVVLPNQTAIKPKEVAKEGEKAKKVKTRLSNEFDKTNDALYNTALEDLNVSLRSSTSSRSGDEESRSPKEKMSISLVAHQMQEQLNLGNYEVPEGVADFDKENWDDVFQISHYAMDIFNYLKSRETLFVPNDYMDKQTELSRWMRAMLVDWMVEVQESFELNHETLYLGVKLVDLYLSKTKVAKDKLQLVGAAAMFIACKYDERTPPLIDDFLYICDGAYSKSQLIRMEVAVIKAIGFDLGMPLSYRFLRRYGRCAKVMMPILTLARYILEYSLMDYDTIRLSDSKLAAASLYLSLQMKNISGWTATLQFYTGYKLEDFIDVVHLLNAGLHRKPKEQTMTIRNKYSHQIFFTVAETPLMADENLKP